MNWGSNCMTLGRHLPLLASVSSSVECECVVSDDGGSDGASSSLGVRDLSEILVQPLPGWVNLEKSLI